MERFNWEYKPYKPQGNHWTDEDNEANRRHLEDIAEQIVYTLCRICDENGRFRVDDLAGMGMEWLAELAVGMESSRLIKQGWKEGPEHPGFDIGMSWAEDFEIALTWLCETGRVRRVATPSYFGLELDAPIEEQLRLGNKTDALIERYTRLIDLKSMPYRDYLRSPEWADRRQVALEEAGHKCQLCSATKRLQVHHRTYDNRGDERKRDLIVLCADCQQHFHDGRRLQR